MEKYPALEAMLEKFRGNDLDMFPIFFPKPMN